MFQTPFKANLGPTTNYPTLDLALLLLEHTV